MYSVGTPIFVFRKFPTEGRLQRHIMSRLVVVVIIVVVADDNEHKRVLTNFWLPTHLSVIVFIFWALFVLGFLFFLFFIFVLCAGYFLMH